MDNSRLSENMSKLSQAISSCDGYFNVKLSSFGVLCQSDRIEEIQQVLSLLRDKSSLPFDSIALVVIGDVRIEVEGTLGWYPVRVSSFYTGDAKETLSNLISSKSHSSQVVKALSLLKSQGLKVVGSPSVSDYETTIGFNLGSSYNLSLTLYKNSNYAKVRAKRCFTHSIGVDQVDINICVKSFIKGKISIRDAFREFGLSWCLE